MRTIISAVAKLIMLGLFFAFTSATVATPSYAGGWWFDHPDNCHKKHHTLYCSGSRQTPSTSTGLFPSRCNGELGFWEDPVVFQNGETLCIARSTADFYGGSNLVPTCTQKHYDWKTKQWETSTSDGACPVKHHHYNPV